MIWLAWRQHRGAVVAAAAGLVVLGVLLLVSGRSMASAFHDDGLASCIEGLQRARFVTVEGGCQDEGAAFASRFFSLRLLGLALFTFVPLVASMFLGAPLIARELEQDTVSIAWTQGVSRRRWAWTQLAVLGVLTVLTVGMFAWLVTWWYGPLNAATGDRFQWLIFDQQGLAPVGFALFAAAAAAFIGAATGRTLRAMALTALAYLITRAVAAIVLRPRFMAPLERRYPVLGARVPNRQLGDWLYGGGGPGVGVVLRANGDRIAGGQRVCPPPDPECLAEVGPGAYNLELFHPASRFWTFQAIETTIFVLLALALAAATVWWIRRRLA